MPVLLKYDRIIEELWSRKQLLSDWERNEFLPSIRSKFKDCLSERQRVVLDKMHRRYIEKIQDEDTKHTLRWGSCEAHRGKHGWQISCNGKEVGLPVGSRKEAEIITHWLDNAHKKG